MSVLNTQLPRVEPMEALRSAVIKEYTKLQVDYPWKPDTDIRLRVFHQIDNLLRPYSLTLLFYEDHLADDAYLTKKLRPATAQDAEDVRFTYVVFVQNSYIYNLTGVVEGALRTILRAIVPNDKAAYDFKRVKNNLLDALGSNEPEHTRDAVTLLFLIRNCIHNNGAHYVRDGGTQTINYRGKAYAFEHGKVQEHASFQTLLQISVDVIRLLLYVVKHKKVQGLNAVSELGI